MGLESLGSNDRTDAAVTLLSLKSTTQICTKSKGGVPLFDWSQVMPSLSYSQDNYSMTLPHFEQALHTVPMHCHMKDAGAVCVAFTKFCQIHRTAIQFKNHGASPQLINTKLVDLWEHMQEQERLVYSKVARNEALLLEGHLLSSQDGATSSHKVGATCSHKVDTQNTTQEMKNESLDTLEISQEQQSVALPVMTWSNANNILSPGEVLYRADGTPVLTMPHNISMAHHLHQSSAVDNMRQDITLSNTSKRKKVNSRQTAKALKESSKINGMKSSTTKRERLKRSASQDCLVEDSSQGGQIHRFDKSFFVRTRRHSMNDSILLEEKINPYFTKNYKESSQRRGTTHRTTTVSPVKTRVNITNLVSPKRNLSISSLSKTLCSPPKRIRNNDNIFDFQYTPSEAFAKPHPPDQTGGKCDMFSYNLLEGASKTTAVNPSFSSRKMFVKRLNSLPNKCAGMFKKNSKGDEEKERGDSMGRSMSSRSSSASP